MQDRTLEQPAMPEGTHELTLKDALKSPAKMIAAVVWVIVGIGILPLQVAALGRAAFVAGTGDGGIWEVITSGAMLQDPMLFTMIIAIVIGEVLVFGLPVYLGKDVVKVLKQKMSRKKR